MKAIHIALRNLLETARDWHSLIFMIAMPVAFTLFFGFVFNSDSTDSRVAIGLIDQDRGALSQTIEGFFSDSLSVRAEPLEVSIGEGTELVRREKLVAVLVVPAGFSDDLLASRETRLRLIVDEYSLEGQVAVNGINSLASRLQSTTAIVNIGQGVIEEGEGFGSEQARQAYVSQTIAEAADRWHTPAIRVVQESTSATGEAPSGFGQSSPGMLVQFAIFGLIGPLSLVIDDRRQGTMDRLLTTSVSKSLVIAGQTLSVAVTIFVQQFLMALVGQLFLGVDYAHAPMATLLMMLALCLFGAGLGILITTLAKGMDHAVTAIIIIALLLSALGGAWFPLDITGATFSRIGHAFPTAWAMDGFQDIVVRGLGLSTVWPTVLILLGYAVVLFGLAVWRLRSE